MIDGVGRIGVGRVDPRASVERSTPTAKLGEGRGKSTTVHASIASEMAAAGPPVDAAKVAAIKAAIAQGNYPVDPDRIAASMVDLDIPIRS